MTETPTRLAPKPETLRELFLKSGNLCAFPNCTALMMNEDGVFIGQVCHIEAAESGGERFNPAMTNEQRRAYSNLMLMCYEHHRVTNDVGQYPIERLQQIKADHERRFSRPDRAILERLTDWTTTIQPKRVENLRRINEVLKWNQDDSELKEGIEELNEFIDRLQAVPIEVRRFLGQVAKRIMRIDGTAATEEGLHGTKILISDIRDAFQLPDHTLKERVQQLDAYRLGDLDEINSDFGLQPALRIYTLKSGWPLWLDVVAFCEATSVSLESFTEDLEFSQFDT
ncbi:hypothetical protein AB7M17_004225 [Bradyrhizobium sp. USDA 377]